MVCNTSSSLASPKRWKLNWTKFIRWKQGHLGIWVCSVIWYLLLLFVYCVICVGCFQLHLYYSIAPEWLLWNCGIGWVKIKQWNSLMAMSSFVQNKIKSLVNLLVRVELVEISNKILRGFSKHVQLKLLPNQIILILCGVIGCVQSRGTCCDIFDFSSLCTTSDLPQGWQPSIIYNITAFGWALYQSYGHMFIHVTNWRIGQDFTDMALDGWICNSNFGKRRNLSNVATPVLT